MTMIFLYINIIKFLQIKIKIYKNKFIAVFSEYTDTRNSTEHTYYGINVEQHRKTLNEIEFLLPEVN